jgi:hypothetical protein
MSEHTSPPEAFDFIVHREDLHRCEFRSVPPASAVNLAHGQVLLAVDAFGFTANNITYAVFGEAMKYWNFFPAPEGWGRVPVWGFANVARSNHPDIAVGERVYGYLPMSTYFVADAGRITASGFSDLAPHRQEMDAFYNQYLRTAADPGYDPSREAEQMILRPLFFTGFLIDDFLEDNGFFGATRVVVSSASSKTSIALAFQLFQHGRERCEVIGLTSPRNIPFVERLGCHHAVVAYTDIETLDAGVPTVFVDMAGDADVTTRIHKHFARALEYSCQVGGTHWEHLAFGIEVPGPTPTLFWAPGQLAKRMSDWGSEGFQQRAGGAWKKFLTWLDGLVTVERTSGKEAIERVYRLTLEGRADPHKGYVLSPGIGL